MGKMITNAFKPKNMFKVFTKEGWSNSENGIANFVDPARVFMGQDDPEKPKPVPELDPEATVARDNERRRLAIGAGARAAGGAKPRALGGNLGSSTLGGGY